MCGILGLFSSGVIQSHGHALQAANDLVSYRGPDGAGFALLSSQPSQQPWGTFSTYMPTDSGPRHVDLVLAHRRLAIIDLSPTASQPMSSTDGSLWITYNGEIYNYIELRTELEKLGHQFASHSDTEVILHAYQEWGEACVNRFNGMWAFAIADMPQRRLFCSRDRFGVKPFHYFFDGKHFLFGSEIKQLLCFSFVPRRINKAAIYEYLAHFSVEHSDQTFFSGIANLLPGHNLTFDFSNLSVKTERFYAPRFSVNQDITAAQASEQFLSLLEDSVRLRLRSDVEVGSCLSGGLDSSSIVCLMRLLLSDQNHGKVQHAFSSHFEDKEANELEYTKEAVEKSGVTAHYIYPTPEGFLRDLDRIIWHQEEPFGSTSIFAQWSVFKSVHAHGIKVMLDGQGADEILAGYPSTGYHLFSEFLAKGQLLQYLMEGRDQRRVVGRPLINLAFQPMALLTGPPWRDLAARAQRMLPGSLPPNTMWLDPGFIRQYKDSSAYKANRHRLAFQPSEVLNNELYRLTFHSHLQALLKYEDRNSMAFSVEGRLPFLDYRVVEFAFSLPSSFKIRGGYTKRVLRESMRGILPEKVRQRVSKLGFATPERAWQRTVLRPKIEDALCDPRLSAFIVPDRARDYLRIIDKSGQTDFMPWLWTNLSLWMKVHDLEP